MAIIEKKSTPSGNGSKSKTSSTTKKKDKSKTVNKNSSNLKLVTVLGVALFALSLFLILALGSYLINWQTDQVFKDINMVRNSDLESFNIGGRWGSFIGSLIIGKWFGIMGLLLPIPLMTLSIYLMNINPKFLVKLTISTIGGIIVVPTALAFLTPYADPSTFGGGYGGGYGAYLNHSLQEAIGIAGTAITLLLSFSIWLIYTFPYSYRWYVYMSDAIKNSAGKIGTKINNSEITKKETPKKAPEETLTTPVILEAKDVDVDEDIELFLNSAPEDTVEIEPEAEKPTDEPQYTFKINQPEEENDDINIITDNFVDGETTEMGGFITKYEGPLLSDIETPAQDDNDSKYDFKVSVTGNAILDGIGDLGDTKIEVNELSEIDEDEFDQTIYDPTKGLSQYKLPPLSLLNNTTSKVTVTQEELKENTKKIVATLENFNIKIENIEATIGPTVTLYEIRPSAGVRISTIKRLEDDIALSLSALGIRIIAPIPGKDTVGIEVPNKNKEIVSMYSVIKSTDFQQSDAELPIVLGKTIQNKPYIIDLAKMPHLLVAGATGQGKSVGLNAIITSLLYKKHPAELKFVMVDPKKVEFSLYSTLEKHYLAKLPEEEEPIIIDTQKVINTLNSLCLEMDTRYELLKKAKVRNVKEYNGKFKERKLNPNNGHMFLPYIVVIIDEFGDLILTAGREIETPLTRLAALARAVGIHLVIATQRPTTNIITGSIKANFPARMAFRVISGVDSKTILDATGASQLIGKGDMLILANNETTRVQCAFIDTPEVERITDFIGNQVGYGSAFPLPEFSTEEEKQSESRTIAQRDALFDKVARYVVTNQQGSASTIQRNFEIGFNRAGRIMDQLERARIVGKQVGSKPRQVLIGDLTQLELQLINIDNPFYGN